MINVGDYATIGQELVDVVQLDPLRVEFSVPETLLAQMQPGQNIDVSVGAYPGETFGGVITAIAPQIDVTGHSIAIRARLPNPEMKLRPGLFAQVSVTLDVKADALLVPEQAIWPIGQNKTVYVIEDGKAVQKTVKLGQREPGRVEIVSGIVAGDEVITAGQMKIFDGADVNPIPATGLEN
jgi:membrane fusion protein (multidrug efflux system)